MTFRSMDEGTSADWLPIRQEVGRYHAQMPERIRQLLQSLSALRHGFAIDQLAHSLQMATRAARDGASEELVLAALCHDIGKVVSMANHPAIGAEILRPYVSAETCWILATHQDFQGRFYFHHFGGDPQSYLRHKEHPAFALALTFSAWDQASFDSEYGSFPLAHFDELIERWFAQPRQRTADADRAAAGRAYTWSGG